MRYSLHVRLCVAVVLIGCDPGSGGADAGDGAIAPLDGPEVNDSAVEDVAPVDAPAPEDGDLPPDADLDGGCTPCVSPDECLIVSGCASACSEPASAPPGTYCGEGGTCDGSGVCSANPVTCGDGIRHRLGDAREGCDDGGTEPGDACASDCVPTAFVVASRVDGVDFPPGPAFGVAADGTGAALYVWASAITTSGGSEVRARRYTAQGETASGAPSDDPLDFITVAPSLGVGVDPHPVVAGLGGGGWVVAWEDPAIDMSSLGIAYRLVRADGTLGTVRRANEARLLRQHDPAIASLGDGVVIAWTDESGLIDGSSASRVVFRVVGATGVATLPEVAVAVSSADELGEPSLATNADREMVVAWTDRGADPTFARSVWARRYFDTEPLDGAPFQLAAAEAHSPSVATLAGGYFAVAWTSRTTDGGGDIVARLLTSTSDPLAGAPTVVAAALDPLMVPIGETEPSVAHLTAQDFVTSWTIARDRTGAGLTATGSLAPPELEDLAAILGEGTVGDVSVSRGPTGIWVSFGIAERAPVSGALRAVYGYLLPPD